MKYHIDSDLEIGHSAMLGVVFRTLHNAEMRTSKENGLLEFENCQPFPFGAPDILADGAQDAGGNWWIKIWACDLDEATFHHLYMVSIEDRA